MLALSCALSMIACAKHDEMVESTTVLTGAPERSWTAATPLPGAGAEPADQLTAAICRRERVCLERRGGPTAGTGARGEASCVAEVKPAALVSLGAIECPPANARAGMKDCLAALATDDCTLAASTEPMLIPACRPSMLCRTSAER
jgi:hypothetical protein